MSTCQCGCGRKTRIAPVNDRSKGWIKGTPLQFLKGHNLRNGKSGDQSPRWNGGKSLSNHGYVVIQTGPRQRQYEHILVAEQALGRKLRNLGTGNAKTEVVHHVRGDKTDNKNLVICTHSYHTELHHRLEQSPAWPEFKKIVRNAGRRVEQ